MEVFKINIGIMPIPGIKNRIKQRFLKTDKITRVERKRNECYFIKILQAKA